MQCKERPIQDDDYDYNVLIILVIMWEWGRSNHSCNENRTEEWYKKSPFRNIFFQWMNNKNIDSQS